MTEPAQSLGKLVLGRYRIIRLLGQGGMGVVYLGRTEGAAGFARPVIIKKILPGLVEDRELTQLFVREARILSNLQHPGIVGITDFGEEASAYVMILDYVHGYNLGEWIKHVFAEYGTMRVDFALHVMVRVLDALQYAHQLKRPDGTPLQIIHRDISPGNILIDSQGYIRVADFGIARMVDETGAAQYRSQEGDFKGKLPYSAPEVIDGESATPASDLFACGVVLYQMLCGYNPFVGKKAGETLQLVLTGEPQSIRSQRRDVSAELQAVVFHALAKDPAERYSSAHEFAEALRAVRKRPDEVVTAEFAEAIEKDFFGVMPQRLGLESLIDRDASWREAQQDTQGYRLSLSSSPPASDTRIELADNPEGPTRVAVPAPAAASGGEAESTTTEPNEADPSASEPGRAPSPRRGPMLWVVVAAIGAAAATAAAVVALTRSEASSGEPRFLVVEKPGGASPKSSHPAEGPAASAAPSVASTGQPPATPAAPAASAGTMKASSDTDPRELSRAFARKQGEIASCFDTHATDVSGQPRISVKFNVAPDGKVTSARLQPASLAGTSLGRCILSTARSTRFGNQRRAVSFTIPITARPAQQ